MVMGPDPLQTKAACHGDHRGGCRNADHDGNKKCLSRRHDSLVDHVLRAQHQHKGQKAGGDAVREQKSSGKPGLAYAEKIVTRQNGDRRDRRQDVAGQLRTGKREKHHGEQRPKHQELWKGVSRA